jgi:hypothetical protein
MRNKKIQGTREVKGISMLKGDSRIKLCTATKSH